MGNLENSSSFSIDFLHSASYSMLTPQLCELLWLMGVEMHPLQLPMVLKHLRFS